LRPPIQPRRWDYADPPTLSPSTVWLCSSVLNSPRAVQMNILIIRAFVKLRELLANHKDLARKIDQLEASQRKQARTQAEHGSILVAVVD
jgi:hypothetical protein